MKTALLFITFYFVSIFVYSQNDTISNQSFTYSKTEIISRYRNLLIDNIISHNPYRLEEIFNKLVEDFDKSYVTLNQNEKWMLCFILNKYDFIINEITNSFSQNTDTESLEVKFKNDQLNDFLYKTIIKNEFGLSHEIRATNLEEIDKDFLLLLLKVYTTKTDNTYQEKLNSEATFYIDKYPDSKYDSYIRNNIRFKFEPKKFTFGIELNTGATILNKKTSSYFSSGAILGFGLNCEIGRLQINTRGSIVFSEIKKDIDLNYNTWQRGENAQIFLPEISFGYLFKIDKNHFITPILGIGWFMAEPSENDKKNNPLLNNISIESKGSPIVGFELGWYNHKSVVYNYFTNRIMYSYSCFNLRYMIQPIQFDSKLNNLNGLAHTIALVWKLGFGDAKRVY